MHPALRVVIAVVGAAFGANLSSSGSTLLGAALGALAGLGLGEAITLRVAIQKLRAELADLRTEEITRQAQKEALAKITLPPQRTSPVAPPIPSAALPPQPTYTAEQRPAASAFESTPVAARSEWTRPNPIDPPKSGGENPLIRMLREYFTGGNTLVRGGVVVLFFGVASLLRYLAEHSHLPIEFRLSGIACGAVVLLVLGWRLRLKRPGYALALQGGAIGILYLTVFSALRLYSLLNPTAGFALLVALSALSATLAILQGSLAVALLGVTGGFLAPFLASTGEGSHVILFSYFVILNAAIVGIAWFRSWRLLNLAGFAFTFVLSAIWGVLSYKSDQFSSTEPFLIVFFLFYVVIAILYSTRQPPKLHGYPNGTIIFGAPIAAFGLQAGMLQHHQMALAYSALAVSGLYIVLAWVLHQRRGEHQRLLVEAFMALGVAFLTLAVPLALDGRWSAASWALEGVALIWVGCRQNRRLPKAFGAILQFAAGAALAITTLSAGTTIPSGTYVAAIMVGMASIYAAWTLHQHRTEKPNYEWTLSEALFLWGLLWWSVGGLGELAKYLDKAYELATALTFATLTALLCGEIARKFRMRVALLPALALLPLMIAFGIWSATSLNHPLAHGGWVAWPLAFAGLYLILRRHESTPPEAYHKTFHAIALWLLAGLLSWEVSWEIARSTGASGSWVAIGWVIISAVLLAILPYVTARLRWPFQVHRDSYLMVASTGLALYLAAWSLVTNALVSSPSAPLPYLPLLNPLDVTQALVILILVRFWMRLRAQYQSFATDVDPRAAIGALALLGFVWLNAVLLRTLHLWQGIPYELQTMLSSTLVETTLSIFWAVLALATMMIATHFKARVAWLAGAVLLVIVVVKLFLVDLSSIGSIERIVSFVGVGLLMLVIGYFSPLPPAHQEST
jgi:uncharacterized membrane protein